MKSAIAGLAWSALLVGALPLLSAAEGGGPKRAAFEDRVVAEVEGDPITTRDLVLDCALEAVSNRAPAAPCLDLFADGARVGSGNNASRIRRAIDRVLLWREADRLRAAYVRTGEIDEALARFRSSFPDPSAYRGFLDLVDLDEAELLTQLRRDLRIARFLREQLPQTEARGGSAAAYRELIERLRSRSSVRIIHAAQGLPGAPTASLTDPPRRDARER